MRAHVAGLAAEQRADIAVYLNFDMIASPNAGYFVYEGHRTEGGLRMQRLLADFLAAAARPVCRRGRMAGRHGGHSRRSAARPVRRTG